MSSRSGSSEQTSAVEAWERAYERFETPGQELRKFLRRLRSLGVDRWDRSVRVIELFCGRGMGIQAWMELGFERVDGLDLSARLVSRYRGPAKVHVGDARDLPFPDACRDVVCIQGGLHHLVLMDDLDAVLGEVHRILTPAGRLVLVEPWLTPFLRAAHTACGVRVVRRLSVRVDALATMIELEQETYEAWLAAPEPILDALRSIVEPTVLRKGWGKLMLVGTRKER